MLIQKSPFKNLTASEAMAMIDEPMLDERFYPFMSFNRHDYLYPHLLNRLFYDGHHWLDGLGWMGPIPFTDATSFALMKEEIRRVFCSKNVIKEVVDRKVDGLLKSRPQMSYYVKNGIDTESEVGDDSAGLVEEATHLFRSWFKNKMVMRSLKEAYGRCQLDEHVTARLFIPMGLLSRNEGGVSKVPTGTIEECLDLIHLSLQIHDSAGEIIDPATQLKGAVCQVIAKNVQYTEIVYVEDKYTIIRTIGTPYSDTVVLSAASDPNNLGTEFKLDIGGRLTMYQPRIRCTITQQVRENQMAINLAKTMQNRNTVTAGFLERIILDAMPPGKWIPDPEDPENNEIYEVGPFKLGAGTTNFFMAAEYRDKETGEKHWGNPSVYIKEPSPPNTFIDSKRDCYQDILEEVGQPHILIAGDATSSGRSKEQAKDTYRGTLEDDEGELVPMIEWMMETVLAMAAFFADKVGYFDTLAAQAKCYLNIGPLTGNERQDNREDVKAGQLSIRTSMMRSGVEDPQAELDRIEEEAGMTDEAIRNKIAMMLQLVDMGFDEMSAAKAVGLPEDRIKTLKLKPQVADLIYTPPGTRPAQGPIQPPNPAPTNPAAKQKQTRNPRGLNRGGAPMN